MGSYFSAMTPITLKDGFLDYNDWTTQIMNWEVRIIFCVMHNNFEIQHCLF